MRPRTAICRIVLSSSVLLALEPRSQQASWSEVIVPERISQMFDGPLRVTKARLLYLTRV